MQSDFFFQKALAVVAPDLGEIYSISSRTWVKKFLFNFSMRLYLKGIVCYLLLDCNIRYSKLGLLLPASQGQSVYQMQCVSVDCLAVVIHFVIGYQQQQTCFVILMRYCQGEQVPDSSEQSVAINSPHYLCSTHARSVFMPLPNIVWPEACGFCPVHPCVPKCG